MAATRKTPRKTAPRKVADTTPQAARAADTVTVKVRKPHAVYWDGQQRSGTLRGVDKHTAQEWARNGWADIT
jgi:hypothetical protein